MPIFFRPARGADSQAIKRLLVETKIGESLAGDIANYVVAVDGRRVIGAAGLEYPVLGAAVLVNVAVSKEFRRQGIASGLIGLLAGECKARGIGKVALCTMYYSYRFFKKRGWVVTKRAELPEEFRGYWQFTEQRYKKCGCMVRNLEARQAC